MFASTFDYVSVCCLFTGSIGIAMEYMFSWASVCKLVRTTCCFTSSYICNHVCLPLLLTMFQFVVCSLDQSELQCNTCCSWGNACNLVRTTLLFKVRLCLLLCVNLCCLFNGTLGIAMEYMFFMGKCV